jgi:acetyltransferase-like isoleucine patch superfamily enzyme
MGTWEEAHLRAMGQVQVSTDDFAGRGEQHGVRIHPRASVGRGTSVWDLTTIREDATVGENCVIGRSVYIDVGVTVGDRCKIEDGALIYSPAVIGDGVFIGPRAVLTNDLYPRAINPDGSLKAGADWTKAGVTIKAGGSVGAGAIVMAGVTLGRWSLIGAGAVVIEDVPDHGLVVGMPARQVGWVGESGKRLEASGDGYVDTESGTRYVVSETGLVSRR